MRKVKFINDGIYHSYNRGVEKRDIFLDKQDYFRFIHDLFKFNDQAPAGKFSQFSQAQKQQQSEVQQSEAGLPIVEPRKLLVEILAFCLMPNHYHLLLKQKREGGMVQFMQKLGTGYTNYFNQKYKRVGGLFQGNFKAISVIQQDYLNYLLYYIHFNPLDLFELGWRVGEINNYQKAIEFLNSYRWSSHLDYLGKKNFPSVTQRRFILKILGGEENYQQSIENWLKEMAIQKDNKKFKIVSLE